jgi:hypothetical protein
MHGHRVGAGPDVFHKRIPGQRTFADGAAYPDVGDACALSGWSHRPMSGTVRQHAEGYDMDESFDIYVERCAADRRALTIKRLDLMDKVTTHGVYGYSVVAARICHQAFIHLARLKRLADATAGPGQTGGEWA